MRIHMLADRRAALDGITPTTLAAGTTVEVPDHLAQRYVDLGAARPVIEQIAEPETPPADPPADAEKAAAGPDQTTAIEEPAPANRARGGRRSTK